MGVALCLFSRRHERTNAQQLRTIPSAPAAAQAGSGEQAFATGTERLAARLGAEERGEARGGRAVVVASGERSNAERRRVLGHGVALTRAVAPDAATALEIENALRLTGANLIEARHPRYRYRCRRGARVVTQNGASKKARGRWRAGNSSGNNGTRHSSSWLKNIASCWNRKNGRGRETRWSRTRILTASPNGLRLECFTSCNIFAKTTFTLGRV